MTDWRKVSPNKEHGFVICNCNGKLVKGKQTVGTKNSLKVDANCPCGNLVASFHTHPKGIPEPSPKDISESYKRGIDCCIGVPETGVVKCYRPVSKSKAKILR